MVASSSFLPENIVVKLLEFLLNLLTTIFVRQLKNMQCISVCSLCFFLQIGTALVSWMLHDAQGCRRVHSTVLIDPVTFLLCEPTVATSFVYKNPTTELEFMMHYFVSR